MKSIAFSMHQQMPVGNRVIQLADILALFPDNDWFWRILDFDGVGELPNGDLWPSFMKTIIDIPGGRRMSWPQLKEFALGLRQTWDCKIFALENEQDSPELKEGIRTPFECQVAIEAFDSDTWTIKVAEDEIKLIDELSKKFGIFRNS
jgi:hypothetical protein